MQAWQHPLPPVPDDFAERPILALLHAATARDPDAIAVVDGSTRVKYGRFLALVEHAAGRIAAMTPAGGTVAMVVPDTVSGLACTIGCLLAGRVCISLDPAQPEERLAATLRDAAPSFTVMPGDMAALLDGAADPLPAGEGDPDAPAAVHYTSGSTGRPKGIVTSRYATLRRAWINSDDWRMGPPDRLLGVFNLSGNNALSRHLAALCSGARLVLCNVAAEGPDILLSRMAQERCTILAVGPAILRAMLILPEVRQAFSTLRVLQCGGAALLPADIEAARAVLPADCLIHHTYASTEAGIVAHWVIPPDFRCDEPRLPSGYFAGGQDFTLTGTGELVVRSRCVALGEWENGRCVPGRIAADPTDPRLRIFHTGDTMRLSNDGLLRFVGRGDAQIKINGVRIEPAEIEAVLRRESSVADAVVVPRKRGLEYRLIGYVAAPGADPTVVSRALSERIQAELPSAMRPSRMVVLEALPRLPGGKIDVRSLPEPPDTPYRAPRDVRETLLCRLFGELTGTNQVGIDDGFFALGGDSLAGMRLITQMREETGSLCPLHLLYAHPTPVELALVLDAVHAYTPLVPFRANGDLPPLFCVHPASGYALAFRPLAEALPVRLPVWGLQARGLEPGETPHVSIAEMAEAYVAAIRSVQPHGPYRLLGWSIGGTIAHEMACQLERLGESVSLLCVLDTPAFPAPAPPPTLGRSAVDARAARHFRAQAIARGLLPPDTPASWGVRMLEQIRLGKARVGAHGPERCQAPVLLVQAAHERNDPAAFAWDRLTTGAVERIDIPCLHTELGDAEHAATIAAAVWVRLDAGALSPWAQPG